MKKIIKLTESDLTRIVKRVMNETKEVNEFFNPFKRKKNDDEHYIKVKKWMGKTNVKLISKLEPKNVNGVVSFTIDKMEDNGKIESIGEIRLIYSGREKAKELENGHMLQIIDGEQTRLLNKYFGGTISRGNKNEMNEDEDFDSLVKKVFGKNTPDVSKVNNKYEMNEDYSDRKGDLYSSINRIIDGEFNDVDPSEIVDVLSNILDHHKSQSYRRKNNTRGISSDEVLRNFSRR